jgi:hypothetical protein
MSDISTAVASKGTATGGKITTKDPAFKLAHKRLTVLQLAESLGNVSEACRRGGLGRLFQGCRFRSRTFPAGVPCR